MCPSAMNVTIPWKMMRDMSPRGRLAAVIAAMTSTVGMMAADSRHFHRCSVLFRSGCNILMSSFIIILERRRSPAVDSRVRADVNGMVQNFVLCLRFYWLNGSSAFSTRGVFFTCGMPFGGSIASRSTKVMVLLTPAPFTGSGTSKESRYPFRSR